MKTVKEIDAEAEVSKLIVQNLGNPKVAFDGGTKIEGLGMDSLDLLELAFQIRTQLGVRVELDDFVLLWNGHIPVNGALDHGLPKEGQDIARRIPYAPGEPRVSPTVDDIITLVRSKI